MSIPEMSKADATTVEPAVTEAEAQITKAHERAASFTYGAQKLMLEICLSGQ